MLFSALISLCTPTRACACPAGGGANSWTSGVIIGFLGATPVDITAPGDLVVGVPNDNDWPGGESPPLAIDDNVSTKFLHFKGETQPTGIRVTPSTPGTIVGGLSFTTANDAPERDPIAYELYGSNSSINGPYTLIHRGEIADFKGAVAWQRQTKNTTPIQFPNGTPYTHYQLLITAVRNPGGANSMQVAEIELLGVPAGGWPPEVDAGDDRIVILPNTTVKLDGTVRYYGDYPERLTMEWSVEACPSGVNPQEVVFEPNELVEDPTVELPPVPGPYTLKLYATDGEVEAFDLVHIAVVESMCPVGNLNKDCIVNLADLLILAEHWLLNSGTSGGTPGDLNGKDGVEMTDYSLLAAHWKEEGPSVVINEFMAINNSKYPLDAGELMDENGDSSDWIELHNTTNVTISLKGWYLTIDPYDRTGWEFPDIPLGPDGYLIIFASGKDRDDPEGELHTDFNISSEAGHLALVKADGGTVAHSHDYPQQFPGISYGLAAPGSSTSTTEELVREDTDAYALIPQNDTLGSSWTDPNFDHSGWKKGRTGVGYDYPGLVGLDVGEMRNVNRTVYIRIPFEIPDLSGLRNLVLQMKYDDGFIAYLNNNIRVTGANDPSSPTWNSGAEFGHDDSEAVNFVDFPLPEEYLSHLRIGRNVLAIHGLNYGITDTDLLILPRLTVERVSGGNVTGSLAEGFFRYPSPGYSNAAGLANLGPAVRNVTENPTPPNDNDNLAITAEVSQTYGPVDAVSLGYRIGLGAEVRIPMADNGVGPDVLAGDGIFTATIPAAAYSSGNMVRWYVTATDTGGAETREPMFLDSQNSPEYFGTVVTNPSTNTQLPVFQYFVQNVSAAGTRTGTRASVYFLGEFYDNIFIRLRGGNTTHGRKFQFNDGHLFRFQVDQPRVDEINLNEQGADPAYVRQPLSWETYALAGQAGSICFPMHVRQNGSYLAVRLFVEQPDRHLLQRVGLDEHGAFYKVYNDLRVGLGGEQPTRKITRLDEDLSDLQALANGIAPDNPNRNKYLFDNVNIPAVINFLAASVLVHENDHTHKNYFLHRDTEGTGEWMFLPWDKDLTFGINNGIGGIIADKDYISGTSDVRSPSHPFFGDSTHQKVDYQWNRLFDAVLKNPVSRQMYVRRLRSVMDQLLQPSATPVGDRHYETRIDELTASVNTELGSTSFYSEVNKIKTQYLPVRRRHFYEDHSINNPTYRDNAGIPHAQPAVVTINIGDIEYNPPSRNQDEEYIELVNPNSYAADISGWRLADAVEHEFPPGTVIPATGSLYVTPSARAFRARSTSPKGGEQRLVQGNYKGHLSSWGETINLYDAQDNLIDTLTYPGNPSNAQRYLRITEIMYHPTNPEPGSPYNDEDFEYIELKNIGAAALSLEGVKFTDGIDVNLPSISLSPGGYLLVVKNQAAFASRYTVPGGAQVAGPYEGQLSNGGENIKLDDITNSTILEFDYSDGWYAITDGMGFSLTIKDPNSADPNEWDSKSGWRTSVYVNGSPGWDDSGEIPPAGTVVINEVLAHSHDDASDWIELHNTTNDAVDIGGWFLSDSDVSVMKYEIAEGTYIDPCGYFVFHQDPNFGVLSDPGAHEPFALSENGEAVYLHVGRGGELMGFMDEEQFDASERGVSFGRYRKSTGTYNFVPMDHNTPGWENAYPKIGPVVIAEIMYHPTDPCAGDPYTNDSEFEYIELYNVTGSPVTLREWDNVKGIFVPWWIDGVAYTFPASTTISANTRLIVARNPAAFTHRYGALPGGVQLLGPCGKMKNEGETIQLSKPGDEMLAAPGVYYGIRVDRVNYSDGSHDEDFPELPGGDPWPIEPDGWGYSLTKTWPHLYGNDPNNWTAQLPSPGF